MTRKSGHAARRNRIKRVLREVFRKSRERWRFGLDVVVNVRPGIHEETTTELEKEFLSGLRQLATRYDD